MEVTDEMVEKLAWLSRLSFNDEEKKAIRADLQDLIAFVDKLKEVDVEGVEPLIHMSQETNVFRDDVEKGSVSRDEGLKNAPSVAGDFFTVPRALKK